VADEQGPFELPCAQFDEDLGVGAIAIGKGPAGGEGVEDLDAVMQIEPVGDNLRRLPTAAERAGQDEIHLQAKFGEPGGLDLHFGATFATELTFRIASSPILTQFDRNSVPHQIKFDHTQAPLIKIPD
jgi:hypothetical protein